MDFSVFANATFLFSRFELKKTLYVVFSYLFANLRFDIVVRTNHHDVASRGAVGRTHTIVRLETRICRKDGTENFGGFVYVLDGFLQRDFCCGFLCARLISVSFSVSLFRLPRRGLPRPYGCIQANRLPRLQGYHTRATTLQINFWVQAGYHTCG